MAQTAKKSKKKKSARREPPSRWLGARLIEILRSTSPEDIARLKKDHPIGLDWPALLQEVAADPSQTVPTGGPGRDRGLLNFLADQLRLRNCRCDDMETCPHKWSIWERTNSARWKIYGIDRLPPDKLAAVPERVKQIKKERDQATLAFDKVLASIEKYLPKHMRKRLMINLNDSQCKKTLLESKILAAAGFVLGQRFQEQLMYEPLEKLDKELTAIRWRRPESYYKSGVNNFYIDGDFV